MATFLNRRARECDELRDAAVGGAGPLGGRRRRRAVTALARSSAPEAGRCLAELSIRAADERVAAGARAALAALADARLIDSACEVAITTGDPRLIAVLEQAGHQPSAPQRRALWLFLRGRLAQCAELDHDGGLLRAAHRLADPGLRQRVAVAARAAGRVEWLRAVVGDRHTERRADLTDDEWNTSLEVLATGHRWDDLWRLAPEAPLPWAARMLQALGNAGWRPRGEADRAGFARLVGLAESCTGPLSTALGFTDATVLHDSCSLIYAAALSSDGRLLAVTMLGEPYSVLLWHLPSGEPAGTVHTDRTGSGLTFTPDGTTLAIAMSTDAAGYGVRLRRLHSGTDGGWLPTDLPVSRLIATAGGGLVGADVNGTWCSWDLASRTRQATIRAHGQGRPCGAVTADGRLLVTGSPVSGRVRLWHLPSGLPAGTIDGHEGGVRDLHLGPDGRTLVTGGRDGTARIRLLADGAYERTARVDPDDPAVRLSPDGTAMVGRSPNSTDFQLWRVPSMEVVAQLGSPDDPGNRQSRLEFTPDGTLLVGTNFDQGNLPVWRVSSGEPVGALVGEGKGKADLALGVGGTVVAHAWDRQGRGQLLLWRPEPILRGHRPLADVVPLDVERLWRRHHACGGGPSDRAWLDLLTELVRWPRRHDVELDGSPAVRPDDAAIAVTE